MVSKTAASTLAEVKEWNGRFLVANFSGSPALTITVHYSAIEGNLEAEDHYDHLTAAVREIPAVREMHISTKVLSNILITTHATPLEDW